MDLNTKLSYSGKVQYQFCAPGCTRCEAHPEEVGDDHGLEAQNQSASPVLCSRGLLYHWCTTLYHWGTTLVYQLTRRRLRRSWA